MASLKQTEAYDSNNNVDLLLSWTPGIQQVDVQIRIKGIPDSGTSKLGNFITDQPDGNCTAKQNEFAYNTEYTFDVPMNVNDEPDHIETYQYRLSCRAHKVTVTIPTGGGTTSTASAKAILN